MSPAGCDFQAEPAISREQLLVLLAACAMALLSVAHLPWYLCFLAGISFLIAAAFAGCALLACPQHLEIRSGELILDGESFYSRCQGKPLCLPFLLVLPLVERGAGRTLVIWRDVLPDRHWRQLRRWALEVAGSV